jgi:hypothetical protein
MFVEQQKKSANEAPEYQRWHRHIGPDSLHHSAVIAALRATETLPGQRVVVEMNCGRGRFSRRASLALFLSSLTAPVSVSHMPVGSPAKAGPAQDTPSKASAATVETRIIPFPQKCVRTHIVDANALMCSHHRDCNCAPVFVSAPVPFAVALTRRIDVVSSH